MVESTLNGVPVSVLAAHQAEIESNGDGKRKRVERDELPRTLFATREIALAAMPKNSSHLTKAFLICKGEEELGWMLAIGYDIAIARAAAEIDGYTASTGPRGLRTVTKEVIASKLATFSDEELAAMGLSRATPGAGQATTMAATVLASPSTATHSLPPSTTQDDVIASMGPDSSDESPDAVEETPEAIIEEPVNLPEPEETPKRKRSRPSRLQS